MRGKFEKKSLHSNETILQQIIISREFFRIIAGTFNIDNIIIKNAQNENVKNVNNKF